MTYIYRKRNNWPVLTRTSLAGFHLPADNIGLTWEELTRRR